jgi:phosphonopyruvate decarboxylase
MLQAEDVISICKSSGYSLVAGVPCSFLKPLINCAIDRPDINYITASSEGEAVAIASGARLAGHKAVVMCQNSGLGNMINPLTSLNFPFRIPLLMLITLRGEIGLQDEPQHELMGKITDNLLDDIHVPWEMFPSELEEAQAAIERSEMEMKSSELPFAFIVRKGTIEKKDLLSEDEERLAPQKYEAKGRFVCKSGERMKRAEAIKIVKDIISEKDAIIATTGKIGRELFTLGDSDNQFYVVGSMGCASGIGFGIQQVHPNQGVVVLDGDGAALMKMGTIATIGHYQPPKFIHIIFDNESYESTGGQSTVSSTVDFCKIASACGYKESWGIDTRDDLGSILQAVKEVQGPHLIHVKVAGGSSRELARPNLKPSQLKERFIAFLQSNG